MKLTKYFLVASAAFMASALMSNVPNHKNDIYHADVLDADVQQLMGKLKNHQSETNLKNFANFYFSNLRNNFSLNAYGTCSYVSMGMLLSYYDTYLNDNFVPDMFEQNTVIQQSLNGAVITRGTESPGVVSEDYDFITSLDNYRNYVLNNPNASFQNFLMNFANSTTLDGYYLGLSVNQQVAVLNAYLAQYVGAGYSAESHVPWYHDSQEYIKSTIKPYLDRGEAVILNVHSAQVGSHSVVAYDYDDEDIYVHTGWKDADGNAITHVALSDLDKGVYFGMTGGVNIESYVTLNLPEYNVFTGVQNNYVTMDENNNVVPVSLKTLAVPFNIKLEYDPEEPQILPVLSWDSLKDEIWFSAASSISYQVKIRDRETGAIIQNTNTGDNAVILSSLTAKDIVNQYGMVDFDVDITTSYSDSILHEHEVYNQSTRISDTQDYQRINPVDYGFPTRSNTYAADFVDRTTQNGFDFKVRKTPNVYTDSQSGRIMFITNFKHASEAYLEYNFLSPITEIILSVNENDGSGMMSSSAYELTKGALYVQGFKNGQYFPDISGLNQKMRHLNNLIVGYETEFSRGTAIITYKFATPVSRVRIHTSSVLNTGPFGKIAKIGTFNPFVMYLEEVFVKPVQGEYLPSNGYEFHMGVPEENQHYYDYTYALSLDTTELGSNYQPGEDTHEDFDDYIYEPEYYDVDFITEMAEADAAPGGLTSEGYTFEEIGKYDLADDGCYKVALLIVAPEDDLFDEWESDYKFARQNSDGTWSFANIYGFEEITNKDANDDVIYDPANLSYYHNHKKYVLRSDADIKFFQVSREKGAIGGEECGEYFPPIDPFYNGTHDLTRDEDFYVIEPPFTPIFTGEF